MYDNRCSMYRARVSSVWRVPGRPPVAATGAGSRPSRIIAAISFKPVSALIGRDPSRTNFMPL